MRHTRTIPYPQGPTWDRLGGSSGVGRVGSPQVEAVHPASSPPFPSTRVSGHDGREWSCARGSASRKSGAKCLGDRLSNLGLSNGQKCLDNSCERASPYCADQSPPHRHGLTLLSKTRQSLRCLTRSEGLGSRHPTAQSNLPAHFYGTSRPVSFIACGGWRGSKNGWPSRSWCGRVTGPRLTQRGSMTWCGPKCGKWVWASGWCFRGSFSRG